MIIKKMIVVLLLVLLSTPYVYAGDGSERRQSPPRSQYKKGVSRGGGYYHGDRRGGRHGGRLGRRDGRHYGRRHRGDYGWRGFPWSIFIPPVLPIPYLASAPYYGPRRVWIEERCYRVPGYYNRYGDWVERGLECEPGRWEVR